MVDTKDRWPKKLFVMFYLMGVLLHIHDVQALMVPGSKDATDCSICHIDWMPDFGTGEPTLVPFQNLIMTETGTQKMASTRRMCFTCHDGFVNDSRFQFSADSHSHPVGVKPSSKIAVLRSNDGDVYPLNEDGKLYCGTCHTAHGNEWNNKDTSLFMRSNNKNSSMCIDCHQGKNQVPANHPMTRIENQGQLNSLSDKPMLGTGGRVICETCHKSHNAKGENLLATQNDKSGLCTACHDNKKQVVGSAHDLTLNSRLVKNSKGQVLVKSGPCSGCHVSHGAVAKHLLVTPDTGESVDWSQCGSCHKAGGIAEKSDIGHFSHPVDVSLKDLGIVVMKGRWSVRGNQEIKLTPLPLFDLQGKRVNNGGYVQCPTCHDPHMAKVPEKSVFLRLEQDQYSQLCTNCHIRKTSVINSKHNINLYDSSKIALIPKPMQALIGVCSTCHKTHNGDAPYMLNLGSAAVSESLSIIQSQCGMCHKKDGAAVSFQAGKFSHPQLVSVEKQMLNSGLPLYSIVGKRTENHSHGKIDCATCHNVHLWDAKHPRSTEGKNMAAKAHSGNSFLRVPANGDSVLCTRCHKQEAQIIDSEHDYRVVNSWLEHNSKQKEVKSGVCNQCHIAHNAESQVAIWGRKPGKAKDVQASFCRSCHSRMNRISKKIVKNGKHPENVLAWANPKRRLPFVLNIESISETPVFSLSGKKDNVGIISCPSCHNPHKWQGDLPDRGPSREMEGSSMNSFLRKQSVDEMVCADCHGLDAIFRYQYFHARSNTKKHPLYIDDKVKKAK